MQSNRKSSRPKITIVGAGFVGATAAHWAVSKQLGDVVLVDIAGDVAGGKALDLLEATPVDGLNSIIVGGSDYALSENSEVVVITAGIPRKPGMSRDDLLATNGKIVTEVTQNVVKYSPNATIIVVSNPLDAMAQIVKDVSGFPRSRVIGMAGILDTSRFKTFIADELDVSVKDVHAFVFGGHGDTMVPMPRYVSVGGVPLEQLLAADKIEALVDRARKGGAEIVNYLKTGSAFFAPSASVIEMVEAILRDQKRILPCACYLEGEYGVNGLFIGVLGKLGKGGLEKVIEIEMNDEEKTAFKASVKSVEELVGSWNKIKG